MSSGRQVFEALRDARGVTFKPFKVVTAAPGLTVSLEGGTVAYQARGIAGQTLLVGDTGTALCMQGRKPLCIKTVE